MAEEEFAADDVWFGNQFQYTESQELEFIGDTSPGLELAEKNGAVDEVMFQDSLVPQDLRTDLPTANPTSEGIPTAALQEEADSSEEEEDVLLKPKAKRNCISYAKKMILASADLQIFGSKCNDNRTDQGLSTSFQWKAISFGMEGANPFWSAAFVALQQIGCI
jgi:hypothetical protein